MNQPGTDLQVKSLMFSTTSRDSLVVRRTLFKSPDFKNMPVNISSWLWDPTRVPVRIIKIIYSLISILFYEHTTKKKTLLGGLNLPGEKDSWDFGEGAGCYLDALLEPWAKHYRMYSYVTKELPKLIQDNFPTSGKAGILGHR